VVCVAILGEGWTEVLRFSTVREAFLHPIVQYGDALICGADDVSAQYNGLERPRLLAKLGIPPASTDGTAWRLLQQVAEQPPEDYATVRAMVARNRLKLRKVKMSVENTEDMANEEQQKTKRARGSRTKNTAQDAAEQRVGEPDGAEEAATAVDAAPRQPPRPARAPMPDNTVLRYSQDSEGRSWSPDHMPCRPGTARYEKFSRFTDGMTVGELRAKNIPHSLIHAYVDRGWIRTEGLVPATQATVAVENPTAQSDQNSPSGYSEEDEAA
jgi:hypothetical protein